MSNLASNPVLPSKVAETKSEHVFALTNLADKPSFLMPAPTFRRNERFFTAYRGVHKWLRSDWDWINDPANDPDRYIESGQFLLLMDGECFFKDRLKDIVSKTGRIVSPEVIIDRCHNKDYLIEWRRRANGMTLGEQNQYPDFAVLVAAMGEKIALIESGKAKGESPRMDFPGTNDYGFI
jgi:hypothetical protein